MSVNVEWVTEGQGHAGIIAEGTYLWDAAKRLGVRLPAECDGRGECDTCSVIVEEGATLLSTLTDAERERLSAGRLAAGERLACQAKIERSGDLRLRPVPVTERTETAQESVSDFRKEFREMPLPKKLTTLAELEAVAAFQTLGAIAEFPFALFEKGLDFLAGRGRTLSRREREAHRPSEHRARTGQAKDGETGRPPA
ncbi:MAG TPA: 2Fe-2S iron-sulfur cluster-binding protein [Pyrinomonadaceae bacterium]|jgi:ferredoxin|nr:2Fe-2S iron-sulfur cluster-binding protein [Pyrinomonadaceae bacterium]